LKVRKKEGEAGEEGFVLTSLWIANPKKSKGSLLTSVGPQKLEKNQDEEKEFWEEKKEGVTSVWGKKMEEYQ